MNVDDAIRNYLAVAGVRSLDLKAALIDMDGVLYDSMRNHTTAWYRMATEMGIGCCRDEFYLYEGMTGAATIDILFNRATATRPLPMRHASFMPARRSISPSLALR